MAAANIAAAANQPTMFVNMPFVLLPITRLLFDTSITTTSSGGAITPLITAVQKRAVIGSIPEKLTRRPIRVETAMTE